MPAATLLGVILVHVTLCSTIRVPVEWTKESEVKFNEPFTNADTNDKIPSQYFEYTAKKPQFAIDVAAAHGVKSPEKHYTSYPIRPYTGVSKPNLGKHYMFDSEKESFYPYQRYVSKNKGFSVVTPAVSSYEVYHPYKAEEPALQELYKDPVLEKIRNDLRHSKDRLQNYENDAVQPDITKDEYLESPEQIDYKHHPQKNKHSQFEIHRPMRRPVYYRPPPRYSYRENILNKKLRHPWNQNYAKVTPVHYRPIKNHIHNLRQHHALKFDDEQNEYPQLPIKESYMEKPDGYDIYKKGRDNYVKLRNNVDESINKAVLENRPYETNEKLELKPSNDGDNDESNNSDSREDEFIPIKNYAQVRKTETTHHLPRQAAFQDAESLEEIKNAPRLREAVKSTKAQIVYSEEGYEDSAYDHAGEQKHASDHEGHGGFLKEHELSGGKYKIPSLNAKYDDESESVYGDKVVHGEKWKNNDEDSEDETDVEDYSEHEQDVSEESDIQADTSNFENARESEVTTEKTHGWLEKTLESQNSEAVRNKRQESINNVTSSVDSGKHVLNKREFKIPEINIDNIYLTGDQISKLTVTKKEENNTETSLKSKYPYYFGSSYKISNDSPLRYAENLSLIPKKTQGGTEFYDSRRKIICPKIEEDIDPVPEKIKKGGNPDDNNEDSKDKEFDQLKNKQRLEGLGDKIDCLKAKYFGENPLDSPFFSEGVISSPEPITKPNIDIFNRNIKGDTLQTTQSESEKINYDLGLHSILDQIGKQNILQQEKIITDIPSALGDRPKNVQYNHHSLHLFTIGQNNSLPSINIISKNTKRKKRATPFTYEPYKIIRESQVQDSKKTTTTNNISPLIKQLQSSRVVDRVNANQNKDQVFKRNTNITTKNYKDIGKVDRQKHLKNESDDFQETDFIDVSVDKRRGEPRYELQYRNHKNQYTPVKNKKAVSLDEYRDQTGTTVDEMKLNIPLRSESLSSISKVNFDVSKYLPASVDPQNSAASNTVNNVILTSTVRPSEEESEEEEYKDYEEDQETQHYSDTSTTTTTTTTQKPIRKRKPIRILMTVKPAASIEEGKTNNSKLRLRTRFRNSQIVPEEMEISNIKSNTERNIMSNITPKLREKKKKVSQSTVVTDSKSYGDEDDDMQKEDIDALIGVKHNTDDYLPEYERQLNKKVNTDPHRDETEEDNEDDTSEEEEEDDDDDDDEGDSSHDDEEDEEEDDEEGDDENIDESSNEDATKSRIRATTPEPTKRTLPKTTVATITTTEQLNTNKDRIKPTVLKKKIEVHRELPIGKSSPNMTHFKQDIKEIEIIKMVPPITQGSRKNLEAFDLYKDENLAKDVNKLGGVEIFKEGLDTNSGPKHGGNYRSIEDKYLTKEPTKGDVETSQSQTQKLINPKLSTNSTRQVNRRRSNVKHGGRNAQLTDISNTTKDAMRSLHGGNLRDSNPRRGGYAIKNAKIIELSEKEDEPLQLHGGNLKARRGKNHVRDQQSENHENSEIDKAPDNYELNSDLNKKNADRSADGSDNAAILLSSYARAVSVLTTAPPFILDPSKRRYYYVDD